MATCALCLKEKVLRDSHIYPEWVYKPLYDTKHRIQILSVLPDQGNRLAQKGMREHLLCDGCEQKLSLWEGYACEVFDWSRTEYSFEKGALLQIRGLDYKKLRLFELSVLWRAGVTTLPFFAKVRLGPHQEILRQLLLGNDPGDPNRYGALMYALKAGERPETLKLIAEPEVVRTAGQRGYGLTFAGFMWVFMVAGVDAPYPIPFATLREDGSRYISFQDALEKGTLGAFAEELERLGRTPKAN